jgi:hypothetical protein
MQGPVNPRSGLMSTGAAAAAAASGPEDDPIA